jgi:predicted DNA-binding protein
MVQKIDKARKSLALWAEDVTRLQHLSAATGKTQVELAHEAILELERQLTEREEYANAR